MKKYYWSKMDMENSSHEKEETSNEVEVVGNTIFFYSPVTQESVLQFTKSLNELDKKNRKCQVELDMDSLPAIKVHIHSYGGELFAGFAAADAIINCTSPVHTHIEGCAASAATIMSVVGDYRSIGSNSFMLIHQLSSSFWGTHEEWKDEMLNQDLLMKQINLIYQGHTNIPKEEQKVILKRDLWFPAEKCLDYKLVDEVL